MKKISLLIIVILFAVPGWAEKRLEAPFQNSPGLELIKAVQNNDLAEAEALLNLGVSPDFKNQYGEIPLIAAAKNASNEMILLLLKYGADAMALDEEDNPAVLYYVRYLNAHSSKTEEALRALLDHSSPLSYRYARGTLVEVAINSMNLNALKLLRKFGADIQEPNPDGESPLLRSTKIGLAEMVEFLVSEGADVGFLDNNQSGVLHWAVKNGNRDLVQMLLKAGAPVNNANLQGNTPLFEALNKGFNEVINLLLEKGADVNHKNKKEQNGLMIYAGGDYYKPDLTTAKDIIKRTKNIDAQDLLGMTALHYAVKNKKAEVVKVLLDNGASKTIKNAAGQTPSDMAAGIKGREGRIIRDYLSTGQHIEFPEVPLGIGFLGGQSSGVMLETDFTMAGLRLSLLPGPLTSWKAEGTVSILPIAAVIPALVIGYPTGGGLGFIYFWAFTGFYIMNYVDCTVGVGVYQSGSDSARFHAPWHLGIKIPMDFDKTDFYSNITLKVGWQGSFTGSDKGQLYIGVKWGVSPIK